MSLPLADRLSQSVGRPLDPTHVAFPRRVQTPSGSDSNTSGLARIVEANMPKAGTYGKAQGRFFISAICRCQQPPTCNYYNSFDRQ